MFMIKNMVDEMEYLDVEGGTHLRMVIKVPKEKEGNGNR